MPARRREPLARDLPAELQVAATNGSILTDSRGRKYIDFVMGWCVANFGWHPRQFYGRSKENSMATAQDRLSS